MRRGIGRWKLSRLGISWRERERDEIKKVSVRVRVRVSLTYAELYALLEEKGVS